MNRGPRRHMPHRDVAREQPRDARALEVIGSTVHPGPHPFDDFERRRRPAPELPHERRSPDGPGSEHGWTGSRDDEECLIE